MGKSWNSILKRMWCKKKHIANIGFIVLILLTIRCAVSCFGGFALIESESMQPILQPHDIILFKHYRPHSQQKLKPGDIVMFRALDYSNQLWVKRIQEIVPEQTIMRLSEDNIRRFSSILKAEGKRVVCRNHSIYLDGKAQSAYRPKQTYLYVVGDNRSVSYDSRQFGYIPEDSVVATVVKIFSW